MLGGGVPRGYSVMVAISVRDLRQRWPQAAALLQVEEEIVIARDARPVAELVRIA